MSESNMSESDWKKLQSIFEQALSTSKAKRNQFLDETCKDNISLRKAVENLLKADAENIVSKKEPFTLTLNDTEEQILGTVIDDWKIIERIGFGGMGSVYLAERQGGEFQQRSALKLVKKGLDTESVIQRFRQ